MKVPEMELRTYLAALAMQGILSNGERFGLTSPEVAKSAVVCADALLDELRKEQSINENLSRR